jgi:hypothetical protein
VSSDDATTGVATWRDPSWVAAALEWASDRLAERGVAIDGKPEQPHVRAWSTAFRLPVRSGAVWLKSVGPRSDQEPALVEALGEWVPERVLVPFAVHRERRLMLLPDGGETVRAAGRASSVETWEAMVRDYAQLQVELVPRVEQMLGRVAGRRPGLDRRVPRTGHPRRARRRIGRLTGTLSAWRQPTMPPATCTSPAPSSYPRPR